MTAQPMYYQRGLGCFPHLILIVLLLLQLGCGTQKGMSNISHNHILKFHS